MAFPPTLSFFPLIASIILAFTSDVLQSKPTDPIPATWPLQFHSALVIETNGSFQKTDLWYDWPNGRNFNIIQKQLGELLYDLEWDNGTSFYYTLDANKKCKVMHFPVGILRPNFLQDAEYVGQQYRDNFLCNVWKKVDFITYYEDVLSKRPVGWDFFTGMNTHVMTFEVGKVLGDPNWQAPVYCFREADEEEAKNKPYAGRDDAGALGLLSLMKGSTMKLLQQL